MGTAIHGGFVKVTKDGYFGGKQILNKTPIKTSCGFYRDYTLFAILSDVRNGHGFAECYSHEPIYPITSGRGLPDFLEVEDEGTEYLYNKWYGEKYRLGK